jgi:hypothetical protein
MSIRVNRQEEESITQWIEDTASRNIRPRDIPSPVGRSTAGWTEIRAKIPQDLSGMIEQLVEHPALRGKFHTRSHVAWTLMHLGAAALYRYLKNEWREQDNIIHSTMHHLTQVNAEHNAIMDRRALLDAGVVSLSNITEYLKWGTPEGKYLAWKSLSDSYDAQHLAPNREEYNNMMSGESEDSWMETENAEARRYYARMLRGQRDEVYIELTEEYFDQLANG